MKKLYKSVSDRKLAGVCGGFAEFFNIDVTIIRLVWAIAAFSTGVGIVAYLIAAIVMSDDPGYIEMD